MRPYLLRTDISSLLHNHTSPAILKCRINLHMFEQILFQVDEHLFIGLLRRPSVRMQYTSSGRQMSTVMCQLLTVAEV